MPDIILLLDLEGYAPISGLRNKNKNPQDRNKNNNLNVFKEMFRSLTLLDFVTIFVLNLITQTSSLADLASRNTQNINWVATWQNQQNDCAPSEDSDQPGHPPNLISVFAVRMKEVWVLSYPLSTHRRLWSDWANAQADLSLRWVHSHFVGFVMSWLNSY